MGEYPADQVGRHEADRERKFHRHLRCFANNVHRGDGWSHLIIPAMEYHRDRALMGGVVRVIVTTLMKRGAGCHRIQNEQLQHQQDCQELPEGSFAFAGNHNGWKTAPFKQLEPPETRCIFLNSVRGNVRFSKSGFSTQTLCVCRGDAPGACNSDQEHDLDRTHR